MAVVSLCFSGNPRTILSYREEWTEYLDMIRRQHELRVFFHCWTETGLVTKRGSQFLEGTYNPGLYDSFDNLIAFLKPAAFRIESPVFDYQDVLRDLGEIYVSSVQAHPRAILSQLHSIWQADEIRRQFDALHGRSDVVLRLRFDLKPQTRITREIDYILARPSCRVLFAPHPHWHGHPGGGGGCTECHGFFDRERLSETYEKAEHAFFETHKRHSNDICDLYAIGGSETMQVYAQSFAAVRDIYGRVKSRSAQEIMNYELEPDAHDGHIKKIVGVKAGHFDMERAPILVPEKLIRENMANFVVVHGESMFVIARR